MTKKLLFLIVAIVFGGCIMANPVDVVVAKQIAKTFLEGKGLKDVELTDVSRQVGLTYQYVFNGTNQNCFVIMSADDKVKPILGYSTENLFGTSNLPANVISWIIGYENQIEYAVEKDIEVEDSVMSEWNTLKSGGVIAPKSTRAVSPLVLTYWDQSPYYNSNCPYDYNEGDLTVTGCVATAMAQVMKFWNFPLHGKGYYSYQWYLGTLSANFATTTYDWGNMPSSLSPSSSYAQIDAVSTLMYHCGVSVGMDYHVDQSGISDPMLIVNALKSNFRYDNGVRLVEKDNYLLGSWISLLKTELDAHRPILYMGFGEGGHCFVCDGYNSNNDFHFNWGWSGYCDGYYSVTDLTPGIGGIGAGGGSYTLGQLAVIGIKPSASSEPDLEMRSTLYISDADFGANVVGSLQVLNTSYSDYNGYLAVIILNEMDMIVGSQFFGGNIPYNNYADADIDISGGAPLVPGFYYAIAVYSDDGNDWDIVPDGQNAYSTTAFYINSWGDLETNSDFTPTCFTQGQDATINVDVTNRSNHTFYGKVRLRLVNVEDGTTAQNIQILNITDGLQPNYHYTNGLNFTGNITVEPGTYLLELAYQNSGETQWYYVGSTDYFNPVLVTVVGPPTLAVSPSALSFSRTGGTRLVEVVGNTAWTASVSDSWLSISTNSGFGGNQIMVRADVNNSGAERNGTITVTYGDLSAIVYVTQNGPGDEDVNCLVLHQDRFASGSDVYRVSNNGGYVCGSNTYGANQAKAEWFRLSGNYNVRSVDFKYAVDGSNGSVTFKIWDTYAGNPGAELASTTVPLSTLYSAASNENGTRTGVYTWVLTSPVPVSDKFFAGIDVSNAGSNFGLYSTTEGSGYYDAYEYIDGYWDEIDSDWDLDISMYILPTVCPSRLRVDPESLDFEPYGESKTASVFSNTIWSAESSAEWLTISPNSGSANGTITVEAAENISTESRTATITVSGTNVENKTISVTQGGFVYTLDVDQTSLNYAFSGENKVVNVTSNTSWSVSCSEDWITINPTSGSNVGSITIIAQPNNDTNSRTATITVSGENVESKTIEVSQAAFEYVLAVGPQILNFVAEGEAKTLSVNSNTTWSAVSSADWLSVTPTSGSNNGTLIVVATANTSTQQRTATITVSGENVETKTIAVAQEGYVYTFEVSPTELDFVAEGETKIVSITSNTSWTAISSADWLNVSPVEGANNGTLIVVAAENPLITQRTALIVISGESVETQTISVTQAGFLYVLDVTPTTLNFDASGEEKSITITSNTIWTVTSTANWLTVSQASGRNDGNVTVVAAENTSAQERTASIIVSGENVEAEIISVTQSGATTSINEDCISFDNFIFPNPTSSILNITSSETMSSVEFISITGQIVSRVDVNGETAVCNVESFAPGMYFVRIYGADSASTPLSQRKFVKE